MPGQHVKAVFLVGGLRLPGVVTKDVTNGHWEAIAWASEKAVWPLATASGDTKEEAEGNLLERLKEVLGEKR